MTEDASTKDRPAGDQQFVENNWKNAKVTFPPISAEVDGEPCRIVSVTPRPAGSTFVNLTVGDEKRSLVAAHHSWTRAQMEVNDSAFYGVLTGAPAETTLHYESGPKSIAEARTKDRAKAVGRRYFLKCAESDNDSSWRLVSGVEFGADYLDAISHFDWGEKQRFSFDVIKEVVDAQTDRTLTLDEMRADIASHPKAAEISESMKGNLGLVALFVGAAMAAGVLSYFLLGVISPEKAPPKTAETSKQTQEESRPAPQQATDKAATPTPAAAQQPAAPAKPASASKKPRRGGGR